jgi:phosphoglycerate dehydrogenase-like enzyme
MSPDRPVVAIAIHPALRDEMLGGRDLERLASLATVHVEEFEAPFNIQDEPAYDEAGEARLARLAATSDALVVAHGSPRVSAAVLEAAARLRFVGELEGDRFFGRVDLAAASRRGVVVVDTTHGSSWPVAEWVIALAVLGLRDAAQFVRRLNDHELVANGATGEPGRLSNRELCERRVGLIGFGHIAWRLVELLRPLRCEVIAHDPYAPRELAEAAGVSFAGLDAVMASSDVVACLAPLTDESRGLVEERHLRLLAPGSTFINVSRAAVVDGDALERVAREQRVIFCLDVFDPEPIPVDHPLRDLPNVLLTPHLAGTTEESRQRFFALMVDELARHFLGLEPRAQVTPRVVAGRGGP